MTVVLIIIAIVELIIIVIGMFKLSGRQGIEYDGNMVMIETEEKRTFSFEVSTDPGVWLEKDHIVLKVTREQAEG